MASARACISLILIWDSLSIQNTLAHLYTGATLDSEYQTFSHQFNERLTVGICTWFQQIIPPLRQAWNTVGNLHSVRLTCFTIGAIHCLSGRRWALRCWCYHWGEHKRTPPYILRTSSARDVAVLFKVQRSHFSFRKHEEEPCPSLPRMRMRSRRKPD